MLIIWLSLIYHWNRKRIIFRRPPIYLKGSVHLALFLLALLRRSFRIRRQFQLNIMNCPINVLLLWQRATTKKHKQTNKRNYAIFGSKLRKCQHRSHFLYRRYSLRRFVCLVEYISSAFREFFFVIAKMSIILWWKSQDCCFYGVLCGACVICVWCKWQCKSENTHSQILARTCVNQLLPHAISKFKFTLTFDFRRQ